MRIRLYNGRILTPTLEIIEKELWVKDDKIEFVGNEYAEKPDREIDLKGNLVMPGFKNAHTHAAMSFLRSFADDFPLDEWLNTQIFPMENKLTNEDAYWCSILSIMEYLSSGITSCLDMYFFPEALAKACKDTGFRMVIGSSLNNFKESVEEIEHNFNLYNNYCDTVTYTMAFHAEYTTNIDLMKSFSQLMEKYGCGIYTHCSETKKELEGCIERYGKTPVELFDEIGLLKNGGVIAHGIYLTEKDMDILKNRGVSVVTNPASNCKLASGIAALTKMLDKGINIAIGTDSAASNNCLDMFREMYLATVLQKIKNNDASALPAEMVLNMATINGAIAMNLKSCTGIEVGKKADIIVIDLNKPNMQPINNIVKNIVYSGSKTNIAMTMINGRIVYENGIFNIGYEPEYIYKKVNNIINRIKNT